MSTDREKKDSSLNALTVNIEGRARGRGVEAGQKKFPASILWAF
jgi:hypothetical protein